MNPPLAIVAPYTLNITVKGSDEQMVPACWKWKFDELWETLSMAEDERLWYKTKASLGERIIDDEASYKTWVAWAREKKSVHVTRETGEIVEEDE